jgi:uncharacterized protein
VTALLGYSIPGDSSPPRELFSRVSFGHAAFLFIAALVAGLVNSVAGGGSFISFPALLMSGIAPIPANATNSLALLPGTFASAVAYRNAFTPQARRLLPMLLITGVIGGVVGARILLATPSSTFMHIIPWMLLGATLIFIFSGPMMARMNAWISGSRHPSAGDAPSDHRAPRLQVAIGLVLQLVLAVYVGYFGAGIGILLLALLAFLGMEDIHAMNGVKALVVTAANGVAVVTFIWARAIVWPQALVMLVGATSGGYGGAYLAQRMDPQHIRYLVIVIGFAMSIYFFIRY